MVSRLMMSALFHRECSWHGAVAGWLRSILFVCAYPYRTVGSPAVCCSLAPCHAHSSVSEHLVHLRLPPTWPGPTQDEANKGKLPSLQQSCMLTGELWKTISFWGTPLCTSMIVGKRVTKELRAWGVFLIKPKHKMCGACLLGYANFRVG